MVCLRSVLRSVLRSALRSGPWSAPGSAIRSRSGLKSGFGWCIMVNKVGKIVNNNRDWAYCRVLDGDDINFGLIGFDLWAIDFLVRYMVLSRLRGW